MEKKKQNTHRNYKSRLFEMIYRDKKELLDLYNAVNETTYDNPEELEINTLENAIYLSMHNDVSFVIDSRLSLYEHQSTYSPNLPLRYLMYVSDLYSKMTESKNLYGSKRIMIPPPKFLIFYNGRENRPEKEEMKLSDAFTIEDDDPSLELKAVMLNINPGNNESLLKACKSLKEYMEYTTRVRDYAEEMSIEDAVEKAITECIREDILAEFLTAFRAEAKKMSIYEYDEERQRRFDREEGREEGRAEGRAEGREEGRAEGREEGRAEGREEGRAEGREEGREEGRTEMKLSTIEEMLKDDIPLSLIAKYFKESELEIRKLIEEIKNTDLQKES